jgi:hypothetical protein
LPPRARDSEPERDPPEGFPRGGPDVRSPLGRPEPLDLSDRGESPPGLPERGVPERGVPAGLADEVLLDPPLALLERGVPGPLPFRGAVDFEERGGLRPLPDRDPEDLSAPPRRSPPCWAITTSTNTSMAGQSPGPPSERMSGGVLLSHPVTRAVPSAQKGLASGFGMGPGVSPSLLPPKLYGDINRSRPYLGNRIVNANAEIKHVCGKSSAY